MSNTTLTDREKALQWWNSKLTVWDRNELINKHYPNYVAGSIDQTEVENMWRKEIQADRNNIGEPSSTPTSTESGELKCTPGEWKVDDNTPAVVRINDWLRVDQVIEAEKCTKDWDSLKELWEGDEGIANAYLIAASKDMYNALKEVSPIIDGLINRTPTGKRRDELCDLNIKVKSALNKAINKP